MPIILQPNSTGTSLDLITSTFAGNALASANITLSTAQQTLLPTLITAASREIIRFCNRPFGLQAFTEIVTPEGGRQDRGEPASAKLSYFPVQGITRCASGRSTILLIQNTDTSTNQESSVLFQTTGDPEYLDFIYTGLNLTRTASGTQTQSTVAWTTGSPFTTIAAVQSAINGLGGGWQATLQSASSQPNAGLFPAAYLVGAREPKNAFSPGAGLDVFTQSLSGYDIDRSTAILRCYWDSSWGAGLGYGFGFGDSFGAAWDGCSTLGNGVLGWPQIEVRYTAGFPVIPEPVQRVCAELVKLSLDRLKVSGVVQSLTTLDGAHQQTIRQQIHALPDWALQVLTFYKDWRV